MPSLRLLAYDGTDHLAVTPAAAVKAIVLVFYLPATPAARDLVARDTSATTDKPAVKVRLA